MFRTLFLPVGLICAVLLGFFLPSAAAFISDNNGLKILVCIIFLVSGYQTGEKGLSLNRRLPALFLAASCISLFLAPLLGLLVSNLLAFPVPLAAGLIIISTMPPTISSGVVITEVSHGNAVLALFLTVSINLLGIITMPFMLDFCLHAAGPIDIDQTRLLFKMFLFVLLPFILGKILRKIRAVDRISPVWGYVNSSCVILVVYSSMAGSRSAFSGLSISDYCMIVAAVAMVHCLLLLITQQTGKFMALSNSDNKALVFVASQKTLAIALAVLASVEFETGSAIIVCLVFHFFQLFLDSFLASLVKHR